MKTTLAGVNDEKEIVSIELSTDDGYVSSLGEVYVVGNLDEAIEGETESLMDMVESDLENSPYASFTTIDEESIREAAEETIYEDNIVIERDNKVLMWSESGQIKALDDYDQLKHMFGEDIADAITLIRKLHLENDPYSIRQAEERIRVIGSIARDRRIPRTPKQVYERYKDMFRW